MYEINNTGTFNSGNNAIESIGIYLRLSREDDNTKDQSLSIKNQRLLCRDYARNKLNNEVKFEYIDDGFSGTTFDKRQGFNHLMEDISLHKINCIIIKDLSRLGRNYNYVGYLIEEFFPKNHTRLISLNDSYDSFVDTDDYLVFKNVFNEFYSKDISKKVKASRNILEKKGAYLNSIPPYGYRKDDNDKHMLVIDNKVKENVVQIFKLFNEVHSTCKVADILNDKNIMTPQEYFRKEKIIHTNQTSGEIYKWNREKVREILTNSVYIGEIINGKTRKINHKSNEVIKIPKKDWIVVKDKHEPIIEKSLFYDNLKYLKTVKTRKRSSSYKYIFKDKIYCFECNSPMYGRIRGNKKNEKIYYTCGKCIIYGKNVCNNSHYIRQEVIEEQILNELKNIANRIKKDKKYFKKIRKICIDNVEKYVYNLNEQYNSITEKIDRLQDEAIDIARKYECGLYNKNFFHILQGKLVKDTEKTQEKLNILRMEIESSKLLRQKSTMFFEALKSVTRKKRLDKEFIEKTVSKIEVSVKDDTPIIRVRYHFLDDIENI